MIDSKFRIWLSSLSLRCGWEIECGTLRIPSTRGWAILGAYCSERWLSTSLNNCMHTYTIKHPPNIPSAGHAAFREAASLLPPLVLLVRSDNLACEAQHQPFDFAQSFWWVQMLANKCDSSFPSPALLRSPAYSAVYSSLRFQCWIASLGCRDHQRAKGWEHASSFHLTPSYYLDLVKFSMYAILSCISPPHLHATHRRQGLIGLPVSFHGLNTSNFEMPKSFQSVALLIVCLRMWEDQLSSI